MVKIITLQRKDNYLRLKTITNKLILSGVFFRNHGMRIYWKVYQKIYWKVYYNAHLNVFWDAIRHPKIYLKVLYISLSFLLRGKKIVIVYLLYAIHLSWVEGVIKKLAQSAGFGVIVLTHDENTPLKNTSNVVPIYIKRGKALRGLHLIPAFWANLYLTPASGTTENVPLLKPKVYFFHSLVSVYTVYEHNTFDGYDYIYCTGPHHVSEMREWFISRGLKGKCLIPGGYPKLDTIVSQRAKSGSQNKFEIQGRLIFAPTHLSQKVEKFSALFLAGEAILEVLLQSGREVLFRPHPINLKSSDPYFQKVDAIVQKYKDHPRFELDRSKDYQASYESSDMMITDFSGTGFTYGLGFEKPVIFFSPNEDEVRDQKSVEVVCRKDLGKLATNVNELAQAVHEIYQNFSDYQEKVRKFRSHFIFNLGHSEDYFVKNIDFVLKDKRHPDWVYID